MKEITMDNMVYGREYYQEDGLKFILHGFNVKSVMVNHGGFSHRVPTGQSEYIFRYENNTMCFVEFHPFKVFYEDIKEFKFGR